MKDLSIKKLYYSISEVSKITGLEQYVLRYWENEFEQLKPQKNRAGNRIYTNKDIQLILFLKKLLREEKYTIDGAKKVLQNYNPNEELNLESLTKEEVSTNKKEESETKTKIDNQTLLKDLHDIKELLQDIYIKL
ncbi:MAG: MerR family transcriptional regulator [Ignavibacteria bacterium]|jgi:DNA-binding transcriptional MerR regulator|nr:MerR family transcriptional regulator [Ignavibacteria bacterium]MDH7528162.1 MerR family transcriptional regulator [Ignavibacteria bacterium]